MDELTKPLTQGDRRALSRAITLVESTRPDHRARAVALLAELPSRQALCIGLSGTPGVGKSTFIEAFGKMLTAQGLGVAVLAVDPSSARSGSSILGDKTRMGATDPATPWPSSAPRPRARNWAASAAARVRPSACARPRASMSS